MKEPFNRFAVRYLVAVLLGLAALLLHEYSGNLPWRIILPQNGAPWELSKLAYWPMMAALLPVFRLTGEGRELLPGPVLAAAALFFACWVLSGLEPGWGVYLTAWIILAALGTAIPFRSRKWVWVLLSVALGALYVLFALLPPVWAPFLDPHSALAMARTQIPC